MGKRTSFERIPKDKYRTPLKACIPLINYLKWSGEITIRPTFVEPCAGDGQLAKHLENLGLSCTNSFDLYPDAGDIKKLNALKCDDSELSCGDWIITNPPWSRWILHPMIERFRKIKRTWLLFDYDWASTQQAAKHMPYCGAILAIGRVSWMENNVSGFDNAAWYRFEPDLQETKFINRWTLPA